MLSCLGNLQQLAAAPHRAAAALLARRDLIRSDDLVALRLETPMKVAAQVVCARLAGNEPLQHQKEMLQAFELAFKTDDVEAVKAAGPAAALDAAIVTLVVHLAIVPAEAKGKGQGEGEAAQAQAQAQAQAEGTARRVLAALLARRVLTPSAMKLVAAASGRLKAAAARLLAAAAAAWADKDTSTLTDLWGAVPLARNIVATYAAVYDDVKALDLVLRSAEALPQKVLTHLFAKAVTHHASGAAVALLETGAVPAANLALLQYNQLTALSAKAKAVSAKTALEALNAALVAAKQLKQLQDAIATNDAPTVLALLRAGVNAWVANDGGAAPIVALLTKQELGADVVRAALDGRPRGQKLDQAVSASAPALHVAAAATYKDAHLKLEELLAAKCNPNARNTELGTTPLFLAAEAGNAKAVNVLLTNGAAADAEDADGRTPLHAAVTAVQPVAVIQALLQALQPDAVHKADNSGATPMRLALQRKHAVMDAVGALLEAHPVVTMTDIGVAERQGHADAVAALVNAAGPSELAKPSVGLTEATIRLIKARRDRDQGGGGGGTRRWRRQWRGALVTRRRGA